MNSTTKRVLFWCALAGVLLLGVWQLSDWAQRTVVAVKQYLFPAGAQPTQLTAIGQQPVSPRADVIFVHGMGGDGRGTWACDEGGTTFFWPEALSKEMPDVAVWTVTYDASRTKWEGNAMRLTEQSVNLLNKLKAKGVARRDVIFVGHSYGGNLVQQMLSDALSGQVPGYEEIGRHTKGVVFLATPVTGSDKAAMIKLLANSLLPIAGVSGYVEEDLAPNAESIVRANDWYSRQSQRLGIATLAFYENIATPGFGIVVDRFRSDPHTGDAPIGIQANHITIAKPCSADDEVGERTKGFIKSILSNGEYTESFATFLTSLQAAQKPEERLMDFWKENGDKYFYEWRAEIEKVVSTESEKSYIVRKHPESIGIEVRAEFSEGYKSTAAPGMWITFNGFILRGGALRGHATLVDCTLLQLSPPKERAEGSSVEGSGAN